MSKILILTISLFTSLFFYGQTDKFKYDQTGLSEFVITNVDNLDNKTIYKKTVNWIKDTYKKPDVVIDAEIEDESVRFTGVTSKKVEVYSDFGELLFYDIKYTIKVSTKDNKYKFEVINFQLLDCYWIANFKKPINEEIYKKDGSIRKKWKNFPKSIENIFDNLNEDLKKYILKSQDGW
jgi:hypothetical protein